MTEATIFAAALDKETGTDRDAYVAEACAGDEKLRRRVEALLRAHAEPDEILDPSAKPVRSSEATLGFTPTSEQVGALVAGRYKLLEQIGEGGMGTVWVAEQIQPVRRKVALKLIKAGMDSKTVLSRFEAERQALALMDHPNIAKVLDGGTTEGGRPFFVMEYVKGVPLTRYCDDASLSVAERLTLFMPVCQAVQHAHQKGIIHRDLKPSNILICLYDGKPVPKVIDFGLAKAMHQPLTEHTLHTAHGVMMGTPLYMSPEQAEFNNLDVDTRTDIYALGVVLYELLTGTTPLEKQRFKQAAWQEMLRVIKEEEPQRPSARLSGSASLPSLAAQRQLEPAKLARLVRGELDWIVMKCLEKDRSRRYDTANGLVRDVERYLADEAVEACPPSAGYRVRKFARKHRATLTVAATIMVLLVAGVAVSTWQAVRAMRAEQLARANEETARVNEETARANEARAQEEARKAQASAEEAMASFHFIHRLITEGMRKSGDGKRSLTLREVNDETLFNSLASQPLAEARIREVLAVLNIGDEASIRHLKRALLLYDGALGPDAPATLNARNLLVIAYNQALRFDEAIRVSEETLRLRKAKFGSEDPETIRAMNNLASLCMATQNFPEAIRLCQEVLTIQRRKLAADDPALAVPLESLGLWLLYAGKPAEAEPVLRESLAIREKKDPDNWTTFHTKSMLGGSLLGQKKYADAEPLLLAGYDGMKKHLDKMPQEGNARLIESLQRLVQLYEATGKKDKADEWRKKWEAAKTGAKPRAERPVKIRIGAGA